MQQPEASRISRTTMPPKSKNRVQDLASPPRRSTHSAIASPLSSPKPTKKSRRQKDEVDEASVASGSNVSVASSTSSRPGLGIHLIVQLLDDIEEECGINKIGDGESQRLSKILSKREELCGGRGHPTRRKISNKVDKWKKLTDEKYLERCLNRHKVLSHSE